MTLRTSLFALLCIVLAGSASAARIYVTTPSPGIGTGACSLQEAIYSSVLHDTLDGVHGIAIDMTDQGNPPDHFITTGCVKGDGNDTIVLPTKGHLQMDKYLDGDAYNPVGPTATPAIFSTIIIEGNGAMLEWTGRDDVRLFAVMPDTVKANGGDVITTPHGTASGVGDLTLRNVEIKGFRAKGGDSSCFGGGGMGAGGAIYVWASHLTVENSTFDANTVSSGRALGEVAPGGLGGCATFSFSGGGGGIWGNGGAGTVDDDGINGAGGGGGGSKGDGGLGLQGGGGGGGTVFSGGDANAATGGASGFFCGGNGGDGGSFGADGHEGRCPGGGGGGGGNSSSDLSCGANGGAGNYGGGGGGAGGSTGALLCHPDGGRGGFGGGGGATRFGTGGAGGFGGGGGIGETNGRGGFFAQDGGVDTGTGSTSAGGGASLGGAIFNDGGVVTIRNSTFTKNRATQFGESEQAVGGAIFSHDGSLTVENSTFSGNCTGTSCNGAGGAIVVFGEHSATFTLDNTIIAQNYSLPVAGECYVQGNVTGSGAGNLIGFNGPPNFNAARPGSTEGGAMAGCYPAGVVQTVSPGLGLLQDNGGFTRTMAIPFGSVAMSAADAATSLATDQRGQARPQAGGYDIGAYEICRRQLAGGLIEPMFCSETTFAGYPTTSLTIQSSTSSGGTVTPAPGTYTEPQNTVEVLSAAPAAGYYLKSWTGNVAQSNSLTTTIIIGDQPQTVTANFQLHDFALSAAPASFTLPLGGTTASSDVTASALGDFGDAIKLTATGQPTGVAASLSANPLTPVVGTPATSTLTIAVGPSAVPQSFTETITGNSTGLSGALTHSAQVELTFVMTAEALVKIINQDLALDCIVGSGFAQSLIAKVNAYQTLASGGHVQGATNVLAAFQYEVQAQIGHLIVTSCTDPVGGNVFSPGQALIADAQALQAMAGTAVKAAPVFGFVTTTNDAGTAGRTVNLLSAKSVIANASTDAAGFYYFDTSTLKAGAQYTVTATIPKGYKASSPALQTFTWPGAPVSLADFVLN